MKINKLNSIILLGFIAIIGILVAQLLWTKEAFNIEEKKFSQKAHIALIEVAKKLYQSTNRELPFENPVRKISNDYYIVNIDNDFDPAILEFYLKTEFKKINLTTDFEYAVYNCQSEEMIYGNYVSLDANTKKQSTVYFPKHKNLVYYFAIRFPNETNYLFSSLRFWFVLSLALIVILLIYVYSIYTLIQQKKYSELQRDFINNMTHEFKTPLSSILIASNYLIKQEPIIQNERLEKYTQSIIVQGNKLNQHIEKILNVAKWDHSPLELSKEKIAVLPILNDVIENIELKNQGIAIVIESDSKAVYIHADLFHFTNLVYNLIDNSIKYCAEKPSIIIRISTENNFIKLEFIDNGIGISNNEISYIYDKFYRISSNEVNGFGLGLYYVKKVCNLNHWKIKATNNPTQGITQTILIPSKS
ncbi:sensor histidine kinase [Flavobacterium muglaense]|uniref:histidine kinase n=1 Tax=Flavobacterium muglaense TaxID=2764716 RepID=A0A923SE92_9FLAO|nr:HAMP domain-containing sensor histidine kinase [Flavobacterium muglaense]MBC5836574.1 HAMP domain-containing histidine kinase [Flavobacterium muglaense]MBC5843160.1 HAMP domain-containing histidine kinase [Flavobacterium muglaense]